MNNLIGQRFERLVVLEDSGIRHTGGNIVWQCICDCGNFKLVASHNLKSGGTKSCGCFSGDLAAKRLYKHGESNKNLTRLYRIWSSMKGRCYCSNHSGFCYYGAKGIEICLEWKDNYIAFKSWAILHGYKDNLTIDRVNRKGNYEPDNCQWLTNSENARKARLERM